MDDRLAVLEKVAAPPRPGTIVGTVELEGVATDAAGNSSSSSLVVTVVGPLKMTLTLPRLADPGLTREFRSIPTSSKQGSSMAHFE